VYRIGAVWTRWEPHLGSRPTAVLRLLHDDSMPLSAAEPSGPAVKLSSLRGATCDWRALGTVDYTIASCCDASIPIYLTGACVIIMKSLMIRLVTLNLASCMFTVLTPASFGAEPSKGPAFPRIANVYGTAFTKDGARFLRRRPHFGRRPHVTTC